MSEEKVEKRSWAGNESGGEEGLCRKEEEEEDIEAKEDMKGVRISPTCCCQHVPYHLNHYRTFQRGSKSTRSASASFYRDDASAGDLTALKGKLNGSEGPDKEQNSTRRNNSAMEVNVCGILKNIENLSFKRSVRALGRFSQLCGVDCWSTHDETIASMDDGGSDVRNVPHSSSGRPSPSATSSSSTVLVNILNLMRYVPYLTPNV